MVTWTQPLFGIPMMNFVKVVVEINICCFTGMAMLRVFMLLLSVKSWKLLMTDVTLGGDIKSSSAAFLSFWLLMSHWEVVETMGHSPNYRVQLSISSCAKLEVLWCLCATFFAEIILLAGWWRHYLKNSWFWNVSKVCSKLNVSMHKKKWLNLGSKCYSLLFNILGKIVKTGTFSLDCKKINWFIWLQ